MVFADTSLGSCGTNLTATISSDEKTLTITQSNTTTNSMTNWTSSNYSANRPWKDYTTKITKVVIQSNVKTIGDYAFYGMTALSTIEFKTTYALTTIGDYAFYGCTSLKTPSFPTNTTFTKIGQHAFQNCSGSNFTSITIPRYITICGDAAFSGCSHLTSITWNAANCTKTNTSQNITQSFSPFWDSSSTLRKQITSFTFGSYVTNIPQYLCYNMSNLKKIVIPASVIDIGNSAFSGCTNLVEVFVQPTSVPEVGTSVFPAGTNIVVPTAALETSYKSSWTAYSSQISTTIGGSCGTNATWSLNLATGVMTIGGTGAMDDYSSSPYGPWYTNYRSYITSLVVEDGITRIGKNAFYNSGQLTSVKLPASLTSVGQYGFQSCTKITYVNFLGTVDDWCGITFDNSYGNPVYVNAKGLHINGNKLTSATITKKIIKANVFYNDTTLKSVTLTTNVDSIGDYAFSSSKVQNVNYEGTIDQWCQIGFATSSSNPIYAAKGLNIGGSPLTEATITLNKIKPNALYNDTLLTVLNMPVNVTKIGSNAFNGCSKINRINYGGTVDQWCGINFENMQSNPIFASSAALYLQGEHLTAATITAETINAYSFYKYTDLVSLSLSKDVRTIGRYAFAQTHLSSLTIPAGVEAINEYAFSSCSALTSVDMSHADNLQTIGQRVFESCTAITGQVYIPAKLNSIGTYVFTSNNSITSLVVPSRTPATLSGNFGATGTLSSATIYVANKSAYEAASYWKNYKTQMVELVSGQCGANVYYTLSNDHHTLYIYGTGDMYNTWANASATPWSSYQSDIQHVEVANGVTSIGQYAFYGCSNLESVSIANNATLTIINQRAFQNCTSLSSITIPENIISIGTSAFYNCGLTSVTWNAKNYPGDFGSSSPIFANTRVVNYVPHPEDITSFTFGEEVTRIPGYLCYKLSGISSVNIPSGVTEIGGYAFSNCSTLTSVTIPVSVSEIKSGAFQYCNNLNSVQYAGTENQWCSITFGSAISNPAYFSHGLKLNNSNEVATSVSLTVPTVNAYAFSGNTSLTSVVLSSTTQTYNTDAFKNCTNLTSVRFNGSLAQWCGNVFANKDANPLTSAHHFYLNSGTELTNLEIPEAISTISDFAFYNGSGFESISVYSSSSWGANTFTGCVTPTILGDVLGTCGEHLTWRLNGNDLFIEGYGDMEDYANNTSMPWYSYRAQIQNVEFVDEATSVGNNAFNGLTNIHSVAFGDGISSIGEKAFYGCTGLTGTLTFGSGLTTIGNEAFENCTSITSVVLNEGIEELDYKAFYGCSNMTSISIPTSLDTCGGYVFQSSNNIAAVYYQGSVDEWCGIAFNSSPSNPANNTNAKLYVGGDTESWLTFAYITASSIGSHAFYNNKQLTSVVITSATKIGYDAFHGCTNLARLEVQPTTPPTTVDGNAFCFFDVNKTIPFYIPAAGASAYADAARWSDFADNRFLFGSCGENLSFVFAEATGILTISGTGAMTNFANASSVPWYNFRSDISIINIESGVTTIGNYAFYNCSGLTSIALPEGITAIGNYAFHGCNNESFTTITIPESVTNIGTSAFSSCTHVETINFNAANIADYSTHPNSGNSGSTAGDMFNSCGTAGSGITLTFGAAVQHIPNYIFYPGDSYGHIQTGANIVSIRFDENAICSSIGSNAFKGISSLQTIQLPETLETIGNAAFGECNNINTITSQATTPPTLSSGFPSASGIVLYLPHSISAKAAYRGANYWSSFTEANTFPKIVQFSLSGKTGDAIDPQYFDNLTSKASAPSDPADDGYFVFDKWCSDEEGESPFNFASMNITADMTLFAKWGLNGTLALSETDDNSTKLSDYNGSTVDVNLTRSLTNAQYNTFCLPFSLNASQMATAFGAGYDLEELTDVTYDGEVLGLVFTQREALEAGKPYLLQPANNVSNPSFTGVEIDASTPSDGLDNTFIEFHGVYSPTELTGGNKNLLFLGAGNELFWPSSTGDLKGFRAYFEVKGSAQKAVRARIVKKEDTATGIDQITNDQLPITNKFLRNGELLILRDGKTYNAQGMLVE